MWLGDLGKSENCPRPQVLYCLWGVRTLVPHGQRILPRDMGRRYTPPGKGVEITFPAGEAVQFTGGGGGQPPGRQGPHVHGRGGQEESCMGVGWESRVSVWEGSRVWETDDGRGFFFDSMPVFLKMFRCLWEFGISDDWRLSSGRLLRSGVVCQIDALARAERGNSLGEFVRIVWTRAAVDRRVGIVRRAFPLVVRGVGVRGGRSPFGVVGTICRGGRRRSPFDEDRGMRAQIYSMRT